MSAPDWLPALLAEHEVSKSWTGVSTLYTCACGERAWGDAHRAHLAAVIWAELTRRAGEAHEDVAEALDAHGTRDLLGLPRDEFDCCATAAIAALLAAAEGDKT